MTRRSLLTWLDCMACVCAASGCSEKPHNTVASEHPPTATSERDPVPDKLWRHPLSQLNYGAPCVGNGVLYVGDASGKILALSSADGRELWSHQLPQARAGGLSTLNGMLFTGYGYHHLESKLEPVQGGLRAFSLNGSSL